MHQHELPFAFPFLFSRFPFYYELKIIFLIWLISPVSRGSLGSSLLYRKLVHPNLMKREDEIDRWMGRVQAWLQFAFEIKMENFDIFVNLIHPGASPHS